MYFLARDILLALFLALVISSGLESVVTLFERQGVPRTLGVILVFLLAIFAIIAVLYTVVPLVIIDINDILQSLGSGGNVSGLGPLVSGKTVESVNELVNRISVGLLSGSATPLGVVSQIIGGIGLAIAVFVSSFYLSLTKDGVERFIRVVLPADVEDAALKIYDRSRRKIGFWLRTQVFLSIVVGVLVWAALSLLGVPHAFLLGFLAAVFEIVPFVGPILAGGVAVISALTVSVPVALYTLIAFLGIQQIESHALVPLLIGRSVGLHPILVIISLLIGIQVAGFLGALVAVPAAAVLQEIVEEWSGKKRTRQAA